MIEKTETKLDPQNASHGFVDPRHRHFVLLQELWTKRVVAAADHLHLNSGVERRSRRFFFIRRETVIDQLFYGGVVTHDKAIKLPLISQHFRKRERIRTCRNTV